MSKHEIESSNGSRKDELFGQLLESAKELEVDIQVEEKIQKILGTLLDNMDPDHVKEYEKQYQAFIIERKNGKKPREGALLLRVFDIVQLNYFHELGCLKFEPPKLRIGYTEGQKLLQKN